MIYCLGQLHAVGAFKKNAVALLMFSSSTFLPGPDCLFQYGARCAGCIHSSADAGCQLPKQKNHVQGMFSYVAPISAWTFPYPGPAPSCRPRPQSFVPPFTLSSTSSPAFMDTGLGIVAVVNDSDAAPFKYLLASLVALNCPRASAAFSMESRMYPPLPGPPWHCSPCGFP